MGYETRDTFLIEFWDELFLHKDANDLLYLLWVSIRKFSSFSFFLFVPQLTGLS